MLSKEEIEICKKEAKNYIELMETAGDNAGWARGIMWYINQLESYKQKLIEKLEKALSEMQDIDLTSYDRAKNNQRKVQNVYNILFDLKDKLKMSRE